MKRRTAAWALAAGIAASWATGSPAAADDVQVAVAANFAAPMQRIAAEFEKATGQHAQVISGATGKLRAQIENGAPFDVLLAADDKTPAQLEAEGLGVPGTRFTYALGRLVLWSARPGFVDGAGAVLRQGHFEHLAIANPRLAPYGLAATQTLEALGLAALQTKLVQGESVAQTAEFVSTGSAELGFIALSQVLAQAAPGQPTPGSYWLVPANLYAPIRQDAVLLRRASANRGARALLDYLKDPQVREAIRADGYGLDEAPVPTAPMPAPAPARAPVPAPASAPGPSR
ncbi:MAG TPA: molybdate ABC transporter substrate-binding protein [Polyangiaceae bacterium]|jgi:molybdate transport system substrate-binding protein|nr:molybdate ABC transporter substrate-binding protein [Polyangiaceae bacterium]